MSHIATVHCQIKDLDALEEAVKKFNATLKRNQTSFKAYAGTNTKCKHAIELDGDRNAYGIGLRQLAQADEEYELACDFYDSKLERAFGTGLVSLKNEYQAVVAETTLARRGYRVRRDVDTREQIRLVAVA